MKQLHALFLTLCMLGVFSLATAQQASNQDNKKVVIIKKLINEDGQQTVETIITDGSEDDVVLQGIDDESKVMGAMDHEVFVVKGTDGNASEVTVNVDEDNGEKVITINVDGETETIHLAKGESLSEGDTKRLAEKGVFLNTSNNMTWVSDTPHKGLFDINLDGLVKMSKGLAHFGDADHAWAISTREDINCAALGVYVGTNNPEGVYVSNIIGESGAQEAGIRRGDLIRAIDESSTATFADLHEALSHYRPGDVVTVTYERDGVENRVESQLRAWKDLPSFANSRHALVTCDKKDEETVTRKIIVIKKDKADDAAVSEKVNQSPVAIDNALELRDFVAYPNPTEGKFSVQFSAEPVPTVISVYDASGKEILRDNLEDFSGYYNREVDFTGQARGALVLSVEQGGKTFSEQIILH